MPQPPPQSHPRAPSDALSGVAQIQTSNQTVNRFLGGPRPAWMQGTNVDTTDASSSTEPTVNHYQASVVRSTVRPKGGQPRENALTYATNSIAQPIQIFDDSEPQVQRSSILPSPAPTDEPSPIVPAQQESPQQTASDYAENQPPGDMVVHMESRDASAAIAEAAKEGAALQNSTEARFASAHFIYDESATATAADDPRPTGAQVPDGNQETYQNTAPVLPANQSAVHPQQTQVTQVVNLPVQATRRAPEPPSGSSEPPAKRPRIAAPNQAVVDQARRALRDLAPQWNEILNRRIHNFNGLVRDYCEKPRYGCLSQALAKGDIFYVALHQLNCLWSVQTPYIHYTLGKHMTVGDIDKAFQILQCILRKNENISNDHLKWFAEFPAPLPMLIQKVPAYRFPLSEVVEFLKNLAQSWEHMIVDIKRRSYPLIAAEIIGILRCLSPTFQTMLFTVSRRHLVSDEGTFAAQLSTLFHQSQNFESHVISGIIAEPEVVRTRNEHIRRSVDLVRRAQEAASRRTSAASPGETLVSVPQPRRTSTNSQPSPNPVNAQQAPMQDNQQMPSPMATHPLPARPRINSRMVSSPVIATDPAQPGSSYRPHPLPARADSQQLGQQPQLPSQQASMMRLPAQPGVSGPWPPSIPFPSQIQMNDLPQPPSLPSSGTILDGQRGASFVQFADQDTSGYYISLSSQGIGDARDRMDINLPQNSPPVSANAPLTSQQWAGAAAAGLQYPEGVPGAGHTMRYNTGPQQQGQRLGPVFAFVRIPPNAYPCSPYDLASVAMGLHQAEIRSPKRVPSTPTTSQFYQYIKGLSIQPVEIEPRLGLRHYAFDVPSDHIPRLARNLEGLTFPDLPCVPYSEGSLRYRLRVCMRPSRETELTESLWAVSPSYWPEHIMIEFNDKPMELQRKQHHHKDLPLELTNLIKSGSNTARVSLPAITANKKSGYKYYLGIDVVEVRSHQSILEDVHQRQHVTEAETRHEFHRRLKPGDSDDMIIENQTLPISLADPFSSRIFQVPVRGKDCKHLECFDLETWLITRPCKPRQRAGERKDMKEPCMVDVWKCPICDLDARPNSLRIDDFFVQVRKELSEKNILRTKAITVDADSKWSPVEEPDDSEDDTPGTNVRPASVQRNPKVVAASEIIELSDDE